MNRVNILGEALDGLGRWYVAVPPFLIIGFLAALFFLIGAGHARLQHAGERLQKSAVREHVIDDLHLSLARSVATQRGFLLTGERKFLKNYDSIVAGVEPRLETLRSAYVGFDATLADVHSLQLLVGKRLADLAMLVAIQKSQGAAAAIALVRTNVGADTGEAINATLDQIRARESREHDAAEANWSRSLTLSRWLIAAGTLFNMLLVGVAARLVYVDMRRRTLQTAQLRDRKLQLEREAEERNQELIELSTHLQSVAEHEKASLARELHDELGGLLVGARMDISWAEQQLGTAEGWATAHPSDAILLRVLGKLSLRANRLEKAKSYLKSSLAAEPSVEAFQLMGDVLMKQKDPLNACQYFRNGLLFASNGVVALIEEQTLESEADEAAGQELPPLE